MNPPIVELPQNPTAAEVLQAALAAENYSDYLLAQATVWRERAYALHDKVDDMKGR